MLAISDDLPISDDERGGEGDNEGDNRGDDYWSDGGEDPFEGAYFEDALRARPSFEEHYVARERQTFVIDIPTISANGDGKYVDEVLGRWEWRKHRQTSLP